MSESRQSAEAAGVGSARRPPGERLRQARERRGMTVAAVAETLRLSSAMIEALEQDRYEALPPAAFVRGYLRSYSELLGLPSDEVLHAHALVQPEPDPVTHAGPVTQPLSGSSRARVVASVLGVVILALALVIVGWFSSERETGEFELQEADAVPAETAPAPRPDTGPDIGRLVMPAPSEKTTLPETETEITDDAATSTGHEAVVYPEGREPVQVTPREAPPADEIPAEPAAAAPDEPTETTTPPAETTTVQVAFRIREGGQSWVEIEDAAGERVARRLFGSGESFSAEAVAPLSVFLGDAAEVELSINGEPYDLLAHTRANNTARLIIEAASP